MICMQNSVEVQTNAENKLQMRLSYKVGVQGRQDLRVLYPVNSYFKSSWLPKQHLCVN